MFSISDLITYLHSYQAIFVEFGPVGKLLWSTATSVTAIVAHISFPTRENTGMLQGLYK